MNLKQAFALPRFVDQNGTLEIEKDTTLKALEPGLQHLGHQIEEKVLTSGLHGVRITPQGIEGAADPRRDGNVLSGAL